MVSSLGTRADLASPDVNLHYLHSDPEPNSHLSPRACAQSLDAHDYITHTSDSSRPTISSMHLPDPSQFPDPYPLRPSHHHLISPPTLSSAGSSSTRSSAYTSSGSALASSDYSHIHVASGDDDSTTPAMGLTSESFSHILAKDDQVSPPTRVTQHKPQLDQGRWSESYSSSVRSRSSSLGNNSSGHGHETSPPNLKEKPSYDMGWIVDEKDEVGLSEEETDDDQPLTDDPDDGIDEAEEERTSAAVIADEGRGLIVQADNAPIVQLQVQPGASIRPSFALVPELTPPPQVQPICSWVPRLLRMLFRRSLPTRYPKFVIACLLLIFPPTFWALFLLFLRSAQIWKSLMSRRILSG